MDYSSVAEIFEANGRARDSFIAILDDVSESEENMAPEGEKWSVRQVVEHVAVVDQSVTRICGRLISEAKQTGKLSDGTIIISPEFQHPVGTIGREKLEAPDHVQPKGQTPIFDSLQLLRGNRAGFESLRKDLETFDLSEPTFPHPYFGNLTAPEWLILAGGHETRHASQISNILSKLRQ
jgi:hypothetical protein